MKEHLPFHARSDQVQGNTLLRMPVVRITVLEQSIVRLCMILASLVVTVVHVPITKVS